MCAVAASPKLFSAASNSVSHVEISMLILGFYIYFLLFSFFLEAIAVS